MKKFIFVLSLVLVTGCTSYSITVTEDPFKKTTLVKLDMRHKVVDGPLDNTRALYIRELKKGSADGTTLILHFLNKGYAGSSDVWSALEGEAYILAGEKSFRVMMDVRERMQPGMAFGVEDWYGHYLRFYTHSWKSYTGILQLSGKIEKSILSAERYMIRVYTDKNPTTLEATPSQLEKLKEFLVTVDRKPEGEK